MKPQREQRTRHTAQQRRRHAAAAKPLERHGRELGKPRAQRAHRHIRQPAAEQAQQPAAQAAFEEPVATNPYGFTAEQALTTTDQMQIAQIAQCAPELRACIARNPNTYPALIEWLGQLGDPAINAALASRQ